MTEMPAEIPGELATTTPDPRAAHFELVERDTVATEHELPTGGSEPPWWEARLVARNAEETWWTETYDERQSAKDAMLWLGRLFSPVQRATIYCPLRGQDGYLAVWLDDQELGEKLHIPIRYVDGCTDGA